MICALDAVHDDVGADQDVNVPYAEWEEKSLYPVVDHLAATSERNRLTSTMRSEHRVVRLALAELSRRREHIAEC